MRVGSAPSTRTSSSLVALDGTISRVARRAEVRIADLKNVAATGLCASGSVKNVRSWMVTTVGSAGPQRHRVVRRVDHLGADLLGHQRQAALLPGQPGGPVRDRGGRGDHACAGHKAAVALLVGPLAGDGEIGSRRLQGADQSVDVAPDGAAVSGHGGRVDKHTRRHGQSFPFPEQVLSGRGGLRPPPWRRMPRQDRAYALAGNNAASRRRRAGRGGGPRCSVHPGAIAELPGLTGARLRRCPGLGLRR